MDFRLLTLRYSGTKLYNNMFETLLSKYSLSQIEMNILMFLYNNPQYDTATDIVSVRHIAKSHVCTGIKTLTSKGLLDKSFFPNNRKTVHLRLTPQAVDISRQGREIQEKFINMLYDGMTKEETDTFIRMLAKIAKNIATQLGNESENVYAK